MKKAFNYEIYTKSQTGQCNWEIHFVNVYANSENEADEVLKTYPQYDRILTRFGEVEHGNMDLNYMEFDNDFRRVPLFEQQTYNRVANNF